MDLIKTDYLRHFFTRYVVHNIIYSSFLVLIFLIAVSRDIGIENFISHMFTEHALLVAVLYSIIFVINILFELFRYSNFKQMLRELNRDSLDLLSEEYVKGVLFSKRSKRVVQKKKYRVCLTENYLIEPGYMIIYKPDYLQLKATHVIKGNIRLGTFRIKAGSILLSFTNKNGSTRSYSVNNPKFALHVIAWFRDVDIECAQIRSEIEHWFNEQLEVNKRSTWTY